jgi:hypothetical protein
MKKIVAFVVGCFLVSSCCMFGMHRRIKQEQPPKKSFELKPKEVPGWASHKIDKHIVGLSDNCCCTTLLNYCCMQYQLSRLTTGNQIIQKFKEIDEYTSRMSKDQIAELERQNSFFCALKDKIVSHYDTTAQESFIRASNLKALSNPTELFSKELSPVLSNYLGNQIEKKCTLWREYNNPSRRQSVHQRTCELYSIDLCKTKFPIRREALKISEDELYIQAVDISGKEIVWNIQTGEICQAKNCVWLDLEYDECEERYVTYNSQYEIDEDEHSLRVYATFSVESAIANLCRTAFENSKHSNKELTILSQSDELNKLTDFQKSCVKKAIQKAKQKNNKK